MAKRTPTKRTVSAAIRASVPHGKLRAAKIVLSDAASLNSGIGGFTEYDRASRGHVVKIGAPQSDDARGITIRGHETRHASRHHPARRKPMTENEAVAGQIVDDVNIEMSALPNVSHIRPYRRAHLATAVSDLRTIVNKARKAAAGTIQNDYAFRNGQILCGVRTAAMLHHYGSGTGDEIGTRMRGLRKLRDAIGDNTLNAIHKVIRYARNSRQRAKAISMLTALMETEDADVVEMPEDVEMPALSDILAPVMKGDALEGHMKIHDLRPKAVYCSKEKEISMRYTPDGVHLNAARFVNAIVSGESHGLFSRRVRQKPGGTVLIDASGSMGATKENLTALCELCPTATVAYYSGTDSGGKGDLYIYAFGGKRYAGDLPDHMGGNSVDLPAIRWMMELPKPWSLVSDLEFCGGVLGSEEIAHALVERHERRGELTVYRSLDEAFDAFGGKGRLGDAEPEAARMMKKIRARSAARRAEHRREEMDAEIEDGI